MLLDDPLFETLVLRVAMISSVGDSIFSDDDDRDILAALADEVGRPQEHVEAPNRFESSAHIGHDLVTLRRRQRADLPRGLRQWPPEIDVDAVENNSHLALIFRRKLALLELSRRVSRVAVVQVEQQHCVPCASSKQICHRRQREIAPKIDVAIVRVVEVLEIADLWRFRIELAKIQRRHKPAV